MLAVYCGITAEEIPADSPEIRYTDSPLTCLSLAEVHRPEYIIIRIPYGTLELNRKLFELCGCLKRDERTRALSLVALLSFPHRELIEALGDAGADYLSFYPGETPDVPTLTGIIQSIPSLPGPTLLYEGVCPYLDYEVFNTNQEITLCGAYLDHLVINPQRMERFCSREQHRECSYFLKPKKPHEIL
jgi:hypothetical protein